MSKLPGLGELHEGVLERDPVDDSFQIVVDGEKGRQQVVRLKDVLLEYLGHPVRFTIAYADRLSAAAAHASRASDAAPIGDLSGRSDS